MSKWPWGVQRKGSSYLSQLLVRKKLWWPPTRGQMADGGATHVTAEDEFTGMVYCPRRLSSIGIMRCAEYQGRDRCQFGCPNAVTTEQIKHVLVNMETADEDGRGAGSYTCAACGKRKGEVHLEYCSGCTYEVEKKRRRLARREPQKRNMRNGGRACEDCGHPIGIHSNSDGSCLAPDCACGV